jgi:cytoskeletal protein RodZ
MESAAKYHELSESDDGARESMLGSNYQRNSRRKGRISSYVLYTTLAVSGLINILWLFNTFSKSKDIRIPNPIFCTILPAIVK